MKTYQKVIAPVFSLLCFFLIFSFKTLPSGKLWKEYNVVYVPVETNDSMIVNAFKASGIDYFVSLNKQYLPVLLQENSPEVSLFKANYSNPEYSYYSKRNSYFYDKSNKFRVYYVPVEYKNKIKNALTQLSQMNIQAGADINSSYPWFLPVLVSAFAILLFFFSKNKINYAISTIFSILFIFCNPFYPVAFSEFITLLCLFFISNIWMRKGAINFLLSNIYILILLVAAIICCFGASIKTGLFFILSLAGTLSILFTCYFIEDFLNSKKSFNPVLIKPAKKKSLFAGKQKQISIAVSVAGFITFIFLFLSSSASINSHFAKLMLPSSKGIEAQELPGMNEYYEWIWNIKTAPYKSLNKSTSANLNEVVFPRYVSTGTKLSVSYDKLTKDENFIQKTYNDIDKLQFEAIEKIMKSEGENFNGSYASLNSLSISFFEIIAMLFTFMLLLFLFISVMIGKGIIK